MLSLEAGWFFSGTALDSEEMYVSACWRVSGGFVMPRRSTFWKENVNRDRVKVPVTLFRMQFFYCPRADKPALMGNVWETAPCLSTLQLPSHVLHLNSKATSHQIQPHKILIIPTEICKERESLLFCSPAYIAALPNVALEECVSVFDFVLFYQ